MEKLSRILHQRPPPSHPGQWGWGIRCFAPADLRGLGGWGRWLSASGSSGQWGTEDHLVRGL